MEKGNIAHIWKKDGDEIIQTIEQHSKEAAEYSEDILSSIGLGKTAYLAGLLHDMGKAKEEFEQYIRAASNGEKVIRGSVNHTFAGVKYILERYHGRNADVYERLTAEVIAYAIGGHHGVFDILDIRGNSGLSYRESKSDKEIGYSEAKENFEKNVMDEEGIDEIFKEAKEEIKAVLADMEKIGCSSEENHYRLGALARMVLSAVIEGDRKSTIKSSAEGQKIENSGTCDWNKQSECMEKKLKCFSQDSDIDRVRGYISSQCKEFARNDTGIYRLTVPTGGGKTLSSLRYCLKHAESKNKNRIIFIIPLLSILDQNSKEIRKYIEDEDLILEHHSNIIREMSSEEKNDELDIRELALDSWDSPIIISTLVQMLNVCFSHKTSSVRRFKSLCNSIVVIDEIQSLPRKFMYIFNYMINYLTEMCNTTVILSSATQPCFDHMDKPMRISENAEMVRLTGDMMKVFHRTDIYDNTDEYGISMDELIGFTGEQLKKHDSVLVVCNTKAEARELYHGIKENSDLTGEKYHLSTYMCKEHRKDILELIGKTPGLDKKEKVICISTQLVEAGIDFSFECVIRIEAGMDNIIQAAGRCNRGNEWSKICDTYVVNMQKEKLGSLEEIKIGQKCFLDVRAGNRKNAGSKESNLISNDEVRDYYRRYVGDAANKKMFSGPIKIEGIDFKVLDMLSGFSKMGTKGEGYILRQAFKTAGKHCNVFDEDTVDLVVPYNKEAKEIIDKLYSDEAKSDIAFLKIQLDAAKPYTVSVYENELDKLEKNGMIQEVDELGIFILKEDAYDRDIGVKVQAENNGIIH